MTATKAPRLFYFDVARALLMFLGVPYHVARIYGNGRDNAVLSPDRSSALHFLAEFLHSFRMESFFVVAGFFSLLILAREPVWTWLRGRLVRIAVPLVCCTFLFAPIQTFTLTLYAERQGSLGWTSFAQAYWARLSTTPFTIMHLWFLHALLGLTLLLGAFAFCVRRFPSLRAFFSRFLDGLQQITRLPFWLGGLLLMLPGAVVWAVAPPPSPFFPMFFVNKAWLFAPFFFFGAAMASRPELREWVIRRDRIALVLAPIFSLFFVWVEGNFASGHLLEGVAACAAGLFWLHAILSVASSHLNRHTPLVAYLCDASFSVYLFHLPIALLLALPMLRVQWPPLVEWFLLVAMTTLLSVLLHEIVRRSMLLSLMFNGVQPSRFRQKAYATKAA